MTKSADDIADEVERLTGQGLLAAGYFLAERVRETLSVQAPYRIAYARKPGGVRPVGAPYRVATTRATPGAPPRRLEGLLLASVAVEEVGPNEVRVTAGTPYGRRHEFEDGHAFMLPTLEAQQDALGRIIGEPFAAGVA